MIVRTLLALLLAPPWSWVYHLGLLAVLQAPTATALRRWWQSRSSADLRVVLAGNTLLGLRSLLLAAVLLIPPNTPEALVVIPPLERALALLGVLTLAWLLARPRPNPRADLSLLALAAVTVLGLAATWAAWAGAVQTGATFYNGRPSETLWTLATLVVLVAAAGREAGKRAWGGALVFGLLLLGYAGHYLYPVAGADAAGVVRWAELAALPLGVFIGDRRAAATAGPLAEGTNAPRRGRRPLWWQLIEPLIFAGLIYGALEVGTGRFRVDGPSMQPNLHTGEFVLADRLVYRLGPPRRGDVVVVQPPPAPGQAFLKRLIGLPGEFVAVEGGVVRIDGVALAEPYVLAPPEYSGAWALAEDEFFVLGDNRNDSSDSHIWGPVHRAAIVARALLIYWPLSDWGVIEHWRGVGVGTGP
ncbi:MAG: signal peptidase I [Anaerolineales bacterium]|nr:signal peptidase I [Anaerolineales bacterium]